MKRFYALALAVFLLLSLASCKPRRASGPYTAPIEISGQSGVIRFSEGSWSEGSIAMENGEYTFSYSPYGRGSALTIVYPDGYTCTITENEGAVGFPADYDWGTVEAKGYIDALSLDWGIEGAVEDATGARNSSGTSPLLGVALLLLGAWHLLAPRSAWWLAHGWRFKDVEPSDLALGLYRAGGGIVAFIGAVCLVAAL